jgi:ASC-1-like (ASCH) protein
MKPRLAPDTPTTDSREIYVKQEFLEMIKSGRKTLELRVAFSNFKSICIGDKITFKSRSDEVSVRVTAIRSYKRLGDVMKSEDISKLAPGVPQNQIRHLVNRIFKESEIEKYGLLVFKFEKIG